MRATIRTSLQIVAVLSVVLLLAASAAWWSIRTNWFANLARVRVAATLQKATGGRVDLRVFHFDPDTLHADLSGLTIHGTEAAGAPPLLSVSSAEVSFNILSLWSQTVDLRSIVIRQPRIYLAVNADGTTNIPSPKHAQNRKNPLEQLLDVKVKRLDLIEGLLQIDNKKLSFDLTSAETGVLIEYNEAGPSYSVALQSDKLNLKTSRFQFQPMQLSAKARLYQDRADLERLTLSTPKTASTVQLSGKLEHFAHLTADGKLDARLSIDELTRFAGINRFLHSGQGAVSGSIHFDADSKKFVFQGRATGEGVDYATPPFTLRNISGSADVVANNEGIWLHHAQARARGAQFAGEGSIKNYKFLQVEGHVSQIALQEVGSYLTKLPFPWSGSGHGTAHASARLNDPEPDFVLGAKVDIDPGTGGIPTSGAVDVTFHSDHATVEFGESTLRLPNSSASFSGRLDMDLALNVQSNNLADLEPLIPIFGGKIAAADLPRFSPGGEAHFHGVLHDAIHQGEVVGGQLALTRFTLRGYSWDSLSNSFTISANGLQMPEFELAESGASLTGSASAQFDNWAFGKESRLHADARFKNLNLVKTTTAIFGKSKLALILGIASGHVTLDGSMNNPRASGSFEVKNLDAYGQQLNQMQFEAALEGDQVHITKGRVLSGPALLGFSGYYRHSQADWSTGDVNLKADTNGFPVASLASVRQVVPGLNARAEAHLAIAGKLRNSSFEPLRMDGTAQLGHVVINGRSTGNVSLGAVTRGGGIDFSYSGDLVDTKFKGVAHAQLSVGTPIKGDLELGRISLASLHTLVSEAGIPLPMTGMLDGRLSFDGLLEEPASMHAQATIQDLEISSIPRTTAFATPPLPDIVLRNHDPIVLDIAAGVLQISRFEIAGRDTSVKISGTAPFISGKPVEIKADGKVDLALFSLFDPNVRSSGSSELAATIAGPIGAPAITGSLDVRNGSFFLADLPNGLSDVNGSVIFSRNRATIQKMTAHSGGGDISLGGSLSFSKGNPLIYHLEAAARNVRVRYANSISVTSNADLRLSGASGSSILSGALTVTRVVFTPNTDAGNLLAAASSAGATSADQGDFISGLHLDVSVESAPSLQVNTNLSRDVEAEIQIHLRGTPDHPIVLGNITANQGDLKIFGTRFSLNRGEVSFVNAVRVEPVLDLDLETQARGVTVDITVSGTPSKLNFNYRSDPPLQPRDIIALLTVGRTPGVGTTSNAQGASDVSALSSGVNSVLGQAISPVSNRLSKLFGITNIKIDPFVQGITNTPQARLSVEQQISRDVTVTYVTNLSQTSEQIFRFEWSLNRQFSVVAIRDDNGEFGIDFQYKKRFK